MYYTTFSRAFQTKFDFSSLVPSGYGSAAIIADGLAGCLGIDRPAVQYAERWR
jgi:hypothetical protein